MILPNNDPGTESIMEVLDTLPAERFRLIPSMRFNYFSELMKHAAVLVGNSSAGVREAPFLGVPSLDVGTRQNQRASAASITACSAMDPGAIDAFLGRQWSQRHATDASFGAGDAAARFVATLSSPAYWGRPVQKQFSA